MYILMMWFLSPQTEIAEVPAWDSLNPGTLQLVSKLKVRRLISCVLHAKNAMNWLENSEKFDP